MQGVGASMEVKHMLKMDKVKAVAVTMSPGDFSLMEEAGYVIEEDPERYKPEPMVESSRKLQNQQIQFGINMVRAPETWDKFGVRGEGIRVCVMDSGLFSEHSDLTASRISGYNGLEAVTPWNEDGDGHGTHVTGIIAAADNNQGVVGVAPDVEIYVVRVFDNDGRFFGSDIAAAAEICFDAGARIINMSLGGGRALASENNAFNFLANEGIISIAAAGNNGNTGFSYPASYPAVISVAAVDSNRNLASFSQRNSEVDVAAPGVAIGSLSTNNGYRSLSGTSQACPHVAGVVALMMSFNQTIPRDSILTALEDTANHPETETGRTDGFGHGIVDAFAAVSSLSTEFGQLTAPSISPISTPAISPARQPSMPSIWTTYSPLYFTNFNPRYFTSSPTINAIVREAIHCTSYSPLYFTNFNPRYFTSSPTINAIVREAINSIIGGIYPNPNYDDIFAHLISESKLIDVEERPTKLENYK
eukprot:CAMPEP_0198277560 /NCGR_PEP_ID=MMETSP1447-20131203/65913_1 /TAXON_ID=420782 /ORGANISM="Chaetoceros dichaeta, Strain CCMP1751" /LENGTH=475 /DNA_ID=CAMNT_0043972589 /DNA_START=267 /DNA_END=1694 /DNA_ORIENTATION=-